MTSQVGAGRRLAAFAIDYAVVFGYMMVLATVSVWVSPPRPPDALPATPAWMFDLLAFSTLVLPVILYFALTEASSRRATLGKRRMRVAVVDERGNRLGIGRSLLRSGLKFLPWQVAHTSLFQIPGWPMAVETIPPAAIVGLSVSLILVALFIAGLLTPSRRTLYDLLSGSRVVQAIEGGPDSTTRPALFRDAADAAGSSR